jgi:hypothetical protein
MYHPWYVAAYNTEFQAQWLVEGGAQMWNCWTAATEMLLRTYPNPELIAPLKGWAPVPQQVPIARVTRPWAEYREQLADFVPPQLLDLSCRLGRSALTRNWSRGMVGSVVLTWRDVEQHRGMRGTFCYVLNDKPMWRGLQMNQDLEMITIYNICLVDELKFAVDTARDQYRMLLDRTPDTAFLVRWHEEHGQIWPEPASALPEVVQDMLDEYDSIAAMWKLFFGKSVAGAFDSFVAKHKEQVEKMGVPCAFLDIYKKARKPRKANVPELAVDSVAAPAVLPAELAVDSVAAPAVLAPAVDSVAAPAVLAPAVDSVAAPVDEIDRKELDERIDEENRERARQRAARRGMVPALVQPPPPPQPQAAAEQPTKKVGLKAQRKMSRKGQLESEAKKKEAEQAQEQTRAFLKETAPAFREDVAAVAAEPSAQHLEREAARARHAQEAGDRRAAKAIVREDAERRVAEAFGL